MLTQTARLTTALGRSYRLERELGAGGMATVCDVLDYLAGGMSEDEILADFPDVEREDIRAALGKRRASLQVIGGGQPGYRRQDRQRPDALWSATDISRDTPPTLFDLQANNCSLTDELRLIGHLLLVNLPVKNLLDSLWVSTTDLGFEWLG